MNNQFRRILNFMLLFTALLIVLLIVFHVQFLNLASTNYIMNGIIIGAGIFGIGLCFYEMIRLLPEYTWLNNYIHGSMGNKLPPRILRPIAIVLQKRPCRICSDTLTEIMDIIANRFNNARESIRYITNTLIFLGLLGTLWGLITALGGFSELVNTENIDVMASVQSGMSGPLSGMITAFTCSLFGLGASLIVALFGHMVAIAHNIIYTDLGDYMTAHTHAVPSDIPDEILPKIDLNTKKVMGITKHKRVKNA